MWLEVVLCCSLVAWFVYKRLTSSFDRWASSDIPHVKARFPFGSHAHIVLGTRHDVDVMSDLFTTHKMPKCLGMHMLNTPLLAVQDLKLAKQLLVRDFDHFVDRPQAFFGFDFDPEKPSLAKHDLVWERGIFSLKGEQWREVRATFSPIFTSGKMRLMSKVLLEMQTRLVDELELSVNSDIELKSILGKFSMDSIASCAFGVDAQSFSNPDSQFVHHSSRVFIRTFEDRFKFVLQLIPGMKLLMQTLNIPLFKGEESKFFISVIEETLRQRRERNVRRNDLVDLMLDALKENSEFLDQNDSHDKEKVSSGGYRSRRELEDILIVATAMVFLVAGYDTTASAMSFALYLLAKNPEVQRELREEIDQAFNNNEEGQIDYLSTDQFPLLDQVILETLRMFPLVPFVLRECTKSYKVPETNVVLSPGELLKISITQIHYDPNVFPNPKQFNPRRFRRGDNDARGAMLTFGSGPRNCLGMRFALLESKIGLAHILRRFEVSRCAKTVEKFNHDPRSLIASNKEGLWVKLTNRE